jgi:WhiB family redox-sensing transcriptional regulator
MAVCRRCAVRPQCATYALTAGERFGVWGGLTEAERARITRARSAS